MSILQSGATKSLAASYEIDNSLRFNIADSASLERTQVSGNRTTWTFSAWVKRGDITSAQNEYFLSTNGSDDNTFLGFYFKGASGTSPDQLTITGNTNAFLRSTQVFRDPSAWYHIVVQANTTSGTAAERLRVWVNGGEITSWAADYRSSMSSMNLGMNESGRVLALGWETLSDAYEFGGYLAEVYLIDGTAYDADDFGELDSDTNQWIPLDSDDVKDAVTFGTNGFYQKYGSSGGHTSFLADGTYTVPAGVTSVDYLVVGGGGGGGGFGGGGGAGGYRTGTLSVTAGADYSITVGDGGTGGVFGAGTPQGVGTAGGDSVFSTITSTGGGQGGAPGNRTGYAGGSGGGGSDGYAGGAGGSYGNNGGSSGTNVGAGGGGASNVGYNGTANTTGGAGGGGTASSITGASVTYAGGGGGGTTATTSGWGGAGGAGGGGAGNATQYGDASHGTANTGGGGGGGGYSDGGNGGSGIVIIKPASGFGFGLDSSGEGNNFTATNLVATDQMIDTPTNNFPTFNPLLYTNPPATAAYCLSEGNLKVRSHTSVGDYHIHGNQFYPSGKWYTELYISLEGSVAEVLLVNQDIDPQESDLDSGTYAIIYRSSDGYLRLLDGAFSSWGNTFTTGDIIQIAFDADSGKLWFGKNNTWEVSGDPAEGTDPAATLTSNIWTPGWAQISTSASNAVINYGQDSSFAGSVTAQGNQDSNGVGDFYYEPPTDFLALCSSNLPSPEIALPTDHFNTLLYTGTGATNARTGLGFQPDMTWIKRRSSGTQHMLFDSIRLAPQYLVPDATDAEATDANQLESFDSDGFTVGSGSSTNGTSATFVGWNWKGGGTAASNTDGTITSSVSANTTAGMSVVSYTGTGSAATIGHGLSSAPEMVIVKNRDQTDAWQVYCASNTAAPETDYLVLNDTAATADNVDRWNDTLPSASVFTIGDGVEVNTNTEDYIAYCFHSVEGYSKVGSYEGNNNADGAFVYTGFRPAYVLVRATNVVTNWNVANNKMPEYNVTDLYLTPNTNAAQSEEAFADLLSNGFKFRNTSTSFNAAYNYIFYAVAESPFKYSNAR